jgi:hypothetical protein
VSLLRPSSSPYDFETWTQKALPCLLLHSSLTPRIAKHALAIPPPASRSSNPQSLPYHHDWRFRSAARVLSLFFAANESIAVSKFYVDGLDHLDVVNDFEVWARTAG